MEKDNKKESLKRLKIIKGHLGKVIEMVEKDKYCIDILQQSSAVQSALKKVDAIILSRHLKKCVTEAMKKKNTKKEKTIEELIKIYQLFKKV